MLYANRWWIGSKNRTVIERVSVLGSQTWFTGSNGLWDGVWSAQEDEISFGMRYLASFYWAILMTTGLNVPIGPGLRESQIAYECFVCFTGVCMQERWPLPPHLFPFDATGPRSLLITQ